MTYLLQLLQNGKPNSDISTIIITERKTIRYKWINQFKENIGEKCKIIIQNYTSDESGSTTRKIISDQSIIFERIK